VSRDVAEHAMRDGGLPAEKLTVIANGVDIARFAGATPIDARVLGVPAGRRFFTLIGRLEVQKRPAWLLRMLGDVFSRLPEHDLVLVGDGPERAALVQLARDLKLESRVHFCGRRGDVPAILAAADALVLPSAWEGMPNVVLEAMAAARPVVACDVTGVRELLGDADEQIARADDAAGFARRIVEICGNSSESRRWGDENRRRAASFSLERMVAAYAELWSAALASRARSPEVVTPKKIAEKC
jgi:glycosyltransferase involved in cell wall biosynthesis